MKYRTSLCFVVSAGVFLGAAALGSRCAAQNVSGYASIPNPYLLLLREPAVHDDLRLRGQQSRDLRAFNEELDGPLLMMRNRPLAEQSETSARLIAQTVDRMADLLDADQRRRIKQIRLRVRGIRSLFRPDIAERLKLSEKQTARLEEIAMETQAEIAELQMKPRAGEQLQKETVRLKEREQKRMLAIVTPDQRNQFVALLGRPFDVSKLGRVAMKAPELIAGDSWINSKGLKMSNLRGQVVALHFWTFG